MRKHLAITAAIAALLGGAIVVGVARAGDEDRAERQGAFQVTNLVSNVPGLAKVTDRNVVNAWGAAFAPGGPLWVANNGSHALTVYTLHNDTPQIANLVVKLGPQDNPD